MILTTVWLFITLWTGLVYGYGQGTEQFIPIGQSPGVSGKLSTMGILTLIDQEKQQVCVSVSLVPGDVLCSVLRPDTPIYLDFTKYQRPNTVGSWADLRHGQIVELYDGKWLKVRVE
jgi:hypothetical protein